jgi:HAD superfamily hydrolase (TIGR01458 family)
MTGELSHVQGVLLDMDGVLTVSWRPIAGAADTVGWLRANAIPFRLITNTTMLSRTRLAAILREGGFDVDRDEVLSAAAATGAYLREHLAGARCFVLGETDDILEDLEGVTIVPGGAADVVVVAGADDRFTFANLNHALNLLVDGAALVAMQRNLTWLTDEGLKFDAGPYVDGLERASGTRALVVGKPEPAFFRQGVEALGVPIERVAMVGDDLAYDVLAAQSLGMTGVLVRSGKFRSGVDDRGDGAPDHIIGSVAELPALLRG